MPLFDEDAIEFIGRDGEETIPVLVTEKILSNMDKNIYEDFSFSMKENLSLFSEDGFRQDECIVSKKFFCKIIRIMMYLVEDN